MLAADKLQLQSHVKQQATALKEKEFNLHHSNLMTVGTQAAVLAGLDITMFIEFHPADDSEWITSDSHKLMFLVPRFLKFCYYIAIVSAFCANILVVAQTTVLSVMGASLALRGPDGSMMTATNGIYEERFIVFKIFGYGLLSTLVSVFLCVWLICSFEASLFCNICSMGTIYLMVKHFKRIRQKFLYNEEDTVDFTDLFHAGNGQVPVRKNKKKVSSRRKKQDYYYDDNNEDDDDEDSQYYVSTEDDSESEDFSISRSNHTRKRRIKRPSNSNERNFQRDEYRNRHPRHKEVSPRMNIV